MAYYEKQIKEDIPKGYQIFKSYTEVAGLFKNVDNAFDFFNGKNHTLTLKPEPSNKYDENAIIIFGNCTKTSFLFFSSLKSYKLGYVPKSIAEEISKYDLIDKIKTRLKYIGIGDKGGKITLDLLIPKDSMRVLKQKQQEEYETSAMTQDQKKMFKYFKIKIPKDTSMAQADRIIKDSLSKEQIDEWQTIIMLYDDVIDRDNMIEFGIKKISFTLFLKIINDCKKKGERIDELAEDEIYDYALEEKPDLMRS